MSKVGPPNEEDVRKLHAEVNQILNQRFLLTTAGVTLFGVLAAWILPRGDVGGGEPAGAFMFLGALILETLLFVLFLVNHLLKEQMRILASYLAETGASQWEHDWTRYRRSRYVGYTKPQAFVFLTLEILATLLPFGVAMSYGLTIAPRELAVVSTALGFFYSVTIFGMGFLRWLHGERDARVKWRGILTR